MKIAFSKDEIEYLRKSLDAKAKEDFFKSVELNLDGCEQTLEFTNDRKFCCKLSHKLNKKLREWK